MNTRQNLRKWIPCWALVTLLLASLACGSSSNNIPVTTIESPELQSDQETITQETVTATEVGVSSCEPEKWKLVPIGLYEYPQDDGWKILVIPFAIYNGSSYWGSYAMFGRNEITITTEDGFTYGIYQPMNNIVKLPDEPLDSPYSGAYVIRSKIDSNEIVIPPGFYFRGTGRGFVEGTPEEWIQLIFQVPVKQEHYTIRIPASYIHCYPEGVELSEEEKLIGVVTEGTPITLDLDKDIKQVTFPTERPQDDFLDFAGNPINNDGGLFEVIDVSRVDSSFDELNEALVLRISIRNLSEGYDLNEGSIPAYVVGNDGIFRSPGCGGWACEGEGINGWGDTHYNSVGPGQIGEMTPAVIVSTKVQNLKFIWFDFQEHVYRIFNISEVN